MLNYFKECSDCLYIYNLGTRVYNIGNSDEYLVIVNDGWVYSEPATIINKDNSIYIKDDVKYTVYHISKWFEMIMNCEIICWKCACLNKKYVIKEHVKLLMTTDPLKLRKNIDKSYLNLSIQSSPIEFWNVLTDIIFANQIIENHKIVNFKEIAPYYSIIVNYETPHIERSAIITSHYNRLRHFTDGMLRQDALNKIKKKNDENI